MEFRERRDARSYILVISRDDDGYHLDTFIFSILIRMVNKIIQILSLRWHWKFTPSQEWGHGERQIPSKSFIVFTLNSANWMMAGNRIQYDTIRRHFNDQQVQSNIVWSVSELSNEPRVSNVAQVNTHYLLKNNLISPFPSQIQQIILFT